MDKFGVFQAKTRLTELLDRVAGGDSILITKHGTPIARLVPVDDRPKRTRPIAELIADMQEFRKGRKLGPDLTIRGMIDWGRR